jgi:hypothetical protein
MARKKKAAKDRKPMDPERRRRLIRVCSRVLLAVALLGGIGAGYYYADQYVEQRVGFTSQPLIIVINNRPAWMNDFLVEQIANIARPIGAHSSFDHKLLVDTVEMLGRNPWVKKVRSVRRAYTHKPGDTLEVDCDYRAPVALVKAGPFYWLVDEAGVRLSERFTEEQVPSIQFGPDGKTCIRVIEGVALSPPHLPGEQWRGQDLAAGLKMVKYLFELPYTQQILRVDVTNFMGRVNRNDPRLVLETSFHTRIWWGRPPSDNEVDSFIEVNTAHKLKALRQIYEKYGRVDGGYKWLDIRFDQVGVPTDAPPPQVNGRRSATATVR